MGIVEAAGGKAEHIGKVDEGGGKNGKYIGMEEAPGGKAKGAGQKAEADIGMGKKGKTPEGNEGEKNWAAEEEEM